MKGKKGIKVFMLSPHGTMSPFQSAQMYSLQDKNIFNIAIKGVFDDCQDIVKAVSNDLEFKNLNKIGAVNSINWGRILAQIVYYFKGYFDVTSKNSEKVDFTVPTGNFGNICAGHIARMMGLPINHLVVATNENDVLMNFLTQDIMLLDLLMIPFKHQVHLWIFQKPQILSVLFSIYLGETPTL